MTHQDHIQKLRRELQLRKYAPSTINTYAGCLATILGRQNQYNEFQSTEDIKDFLLTIGNQNYHKQLVATFHHFFNLVLQKSLSLQDIPYPRKTHYLPAILSVQEVHRLIAGIANIKHRTIVQLMYSCALRISEPTNILANGHIDPDRKLLLVKAAKGYKDRYVPLPEATITLLQTYISQHHPGKWLFDGQHKEQYSTRSIQQIFNRAVSAAGIQKSVTTHCLRHSRLTHLCEAGIDVYKLKDFAGHNNIKTTEIYLHLSKLSLVSHIENADAIIQQALANNKELLIELT